MSVNNSLRDILIDQNSMLRLYEDGLQRDLAVIYDKYQDRARSIIQGGGSARSLERTLNKEINRTINRVYRRMSTDMRDLISMSADNVTDALDQEVGEIFRVRNTPKTSLRALIDNDPIFGSATLRQGFNNIGKDLRRRTSRLIRGGIASGRATNDIARDVQNDLNVTRHQSRTITRTAITQFHTNATMKIFEENEDIIDRYQYVATLDARTTPICSRNDGRTFRLDEGGPMPPLHWNCRSTTIPIVKEYTDIDRDGRRVKRNAYDNLSERKRAALNGQVPVTEDYDAWLRNQTYDVQLRHLGSQDRTNLFRQGALRLTQFTNTTGTFLSISALRRLSSSKSQRAVSAAQAAQVIVCDSPCKSFDSKNDFQIGDDNGDLVIDPRGFYDSPDSQTLHTNFLRRIQIEGKIGQLGLLEYRGNKTSVRRQNKDRHLNDISNGNTNNLRLDPITGDYVSTRLQNITFLYEEIQDELSLIRNSRLLTDADKDYLSGRFYNAVRNTDSTGVGDLKGLAALNAARRTFENYRKGNFRPNDTFQDVFIRTLEAGDSSSINTIARNLDVAARQGSTIIQGLEDATTVSILGRRGIDIEEIINDAPLAQNRINTFRIDDDIIDDLATLPRPRNQILSFMTGDDYREVLMDVFRNMGETNSADAFATMVGERIWSRRAQMLYGGLIGDRQIRSGPGTSEDWWRTGNEVVDRLAEQGHIDLTYLTSNVKATKDTSTLIRNSNQSSGAGKYVQQRQKVIRWKRDTNLGDHIYDRALVRKRYALGFDNDSNPLMARAGDVYYRDLDGNLTPVPVRTSNLTADYNTIDRTLADRLNNNNQIRRTIEPQGFGEFMSKYLTTRTKTGTRDGRPILNPGQEYIVNTNGYESLAILQRQLRRSQADPDSYWTNYAQLHEANRTQNIGILSPHSGEFWRPAFSSTTRVAYDFDAFEELKSRFAVVLDKNTYNTRMKRLVWFEMNYEEILGLGRIIDDISRTPQTAPKALIRRLESNPLWQELVGTDVDDIKEAFSFGQLAQELFRVQGAVGRPAFRRFVDVDPDRNGAFRRAEMRLRTYESSIVPELDAAESGQGILASVSKSRDAASRTNVITRGINQRLRSVLARNVINNPTIRAEFPWLTLDKEGQLAKILKDNITTSGYNSGKYQRARRIISGRKGDGSEGSFRRLIADEFGEDYLVIVTKADQERHIRNINNVIDMLTDPQEIAALSQIRKEIQYGTDNRVTLQQDFLNVDRFTDPDTREVIEQWSNYTGVLSPNNLARFTEVVEQELNRLLPTRESTFGLIADMFESYAVRPPTPGTRRDGIIPVRSFDGASTNIKFWKKEQYQVPRVDDNGEFYVTSIRSEKPGDIDLAKVRSSAPVLFVFAQDSAIAGRLAARGYWNVYDGFGTNVANLRMMLRETNELYAELIDSNILLENLENLRRGNNPLPLNDFEVDGNRYPGYNTLRTRITMLYANGGLTGQDVLDLLESEVSYLID